MLEPQLVLGGLPPAPTLARSFFARDTATVARDLLGAVLRHGPLAGRIVETEAYLGSGDQAAHSFAGLTQRTRAIFGPPGHAYVYFSYGLHCCLNFVAEPEGTPGCVLIRALEPLEGLDAMFARRPEAKVIRDLCSGPGKLTQALGITLAHYGADLTAGPLTVHPAAERCEIGVSPRIGITKSADLTLRFFIRDNKHVSRR
jgi:DNA-3-methyladenine glycosylase